MITQTDLYKKLPDQIKILKNINIKYKTLFKINTKTKNNIFNIITTFYTLTFFFPIKNLLLKF